MAGNGGREKDRGMAGSGGREKDRGMAGSGGREKDRGMAGSGGRDIIRTGVWLAVEAGRRTATYDGHD